MTSPTRSKMSRRTMLVGTGVAVGAVSTLGAAAVFAQPVKEPQTGTGPATPNPLSSTPVPPEVLEFSEQWPVAQGDLQATRNAKNSPIDSSTVSQLGVLWQVPTTAGITASPVILDGVVYYQDMLSNVFALDLETGEELWRADYNVSNNGPDGVAVAYGMVFAATGDTSTAFALDAATGKEIWSAKLTNNNYECIDMAPAVYDNVVYVSTNPNNTTYGNYRGGARGILYALDAATGATMWSFDTAADNLWDAPRINSGAGLWYPPSFDEKGNMYIGTGNPAPYPGNEEYPNGSSRPAPNDYADSMVSIDLATGGVNWSINALPLDLLDHDFMNSPVLATVAIDGTDTLIAVGSGKTGTVIAANAETGEQLWKAYVGKHQNDELEELPAETIETWPGTLGGVLTPLAFGSGKIFAPYNDGPAYLNATGAGERPDDAPVATGGLAAIDAVTGEIVWDVKVPSYVIAGATVANDLVFSSGMDGILHAYDVETGTEVWTLELPAGVNAPIGIAGDTIVVAAATGVSIAPDEGNTAITRETTPSIVALRIGATGSFSSSATPAATTEATPVESADAVRVEAFDLGFTPSEFTIPADTDVALTLANTGVLVHDLVSDEGGFATTQLSGGQEDTITINLAAGTYRFICSIEGHEAAGMVGTITAE